MKGNDKDIDLMVIFADAGGKRDWTTAIAMEVYRRLKRHVKYRLIKGTIMEALGQKKQSMLKSDTDEITPVVLQVLKENADITVTEDQDGKHMIVNVHGKGIKAREMERRLLK